MPADIPKLPGEPRTRGEVTVRRWRAEDAQPLNELVAASRKHLLPWMPWATEPLDTLEQRRARFSGWEREWAAGGDCVYGIFVAGAVAGGCGLHRRLGSDGLEIGYWLAPDFTGRGVMTVAAELLTDAAFSVPEIEVVEIHHDQANERSAGVPRRLGFTLARQIGREPQAPGERGVEWQWQITREQWMRRTEPGAGR